MIKPNRESVDCFRVASNKEVLEGEAGAFCFIYEDEPEMHALVCRLPGAGGYAVMPIGGSDHPCWSWDGNREKPTLTPSILLQTSDPDTGAVFELWHGYMRAGRLESC